MTSRVVIVKATPCTTAATEFIRKANSYKSSVRIEHGRYGINAKSLISLLSLGMKPGMELTVITDGEDENIALEAISSMIVSKTS